MPDYGKLVEMRYVVNGGEKILQYRSRMPGHMDSIHQYPGEWAWGEWSDVPEADNEYILKTGDKG